MICMGWVVLDRGSVSVGCLGCVPVMASDNDSAGTRLLALGDLVDLVQTFALVGDLELLREVVVTDRSGVDNRSRGQNVLSQRYSMRIVR